MVTTLSAGETIYPLLDFELTSTENSGINGTATIIYTSNLSAFPLELTIALDSERLGVHVNRLERRNGRELNITFTDIATYTLAKRSFDFSELTELPFATLVGLICSGFSYLVEVDFNVCPAELGQTTALGAFSSFVSALPCSWYVDYNGTIVFTQKGAIGAEINTNLILSKRESGTTLELYDGYNVTKTAPLNDKKQAIKAKYLPSENDGSATIEEKSLTGTEKWQGSDDKPAAIITRAQWDNYTGEHVLELGFNFTSASTELHANTTALIMDIIHRLKIVQQTSDYDPALTFGAPYFALDDYATLHEVTNFVEQFATTTGNNTTYTTWTGDYITDIGFKCFFSPPSFTYTWPQLSKVPFFGMAADANSPEYDHTGMAAREYYLPFSKPPAFDSFTKAHAYVGSSPVCVSGGRGYGVTYPNVAKRYKEPETWATYTQDVRGNIFPYCWLYRDKKTTVTKQYSVVRTKQITINPFYNADGSVASPYTYTRTRTVTINMPEKITFAKAKLRKNFSAVAASFPGIVASDGDDFLPNTTAETNEDCYYMAAFSKKFASDIQNRCPVHSFSVGSKKDSKRTLILRDDAAKTLLLVRLPNGRFQYVETSEKTINLDSITNEEEPVTIIALTTFLEDYSKSFTFTAPGSNKLSISSSLWPSKALAEESVLAIINAKNAEKSKLELELVPSLPHIGQRYSNYRANSVIIKPDNTTISMSIIP